MKESFKLWQNGFSQIPGIDYKEMFTPVAGLGIHQDDLTHWSPE